MPHLWDSIQALLGLKREIADVNAVQMALRTDIVYAVALATVRLGSKRLLSRATAFDFIVAFHTNWFGSIVKGQRVLLIKDGQIQREGVQTVRIELP